MQVEIDGESKDLADVLNNGDDEHYQVARIRKYLLSPEHAKFLFENGFSIEDMLNGRIEGGQQRVAFIFDDWNAKLGQKVFHSY